MIIIHTNSKNSCGTVMSGQHSLLCLAYAEWTTSILRGPQAYCVRLSNYVSAICSNKLSSKISLLYSDLITKLIITNNITTVAS